MAGIGPQPGYGAVTTKQHGDLYYAAKRGALYRATSQAVSVTALTAGLPTAYTGGMILWNPVASTMKLSIIEAGVAQILAQTNPALISLGVGAGAPTVGAPTTTVVQNALIETTEPTAKGLVYISGATLPNAPVIGRLLQTLDTEATSIVTNPGPSLVDIKGGLVLMPGFWACFLSSATGTASSLFYGLTWEEIPVSG